MLVALRATIERGILSKKAASGADKFLKTYDKMVHLSSGPLVAVIDCMLQETDYIQYLTARKSETPDESIIGNINELRADAAQADSESEDGNAMERFLEQVTLIADADGLEDSDNKVTLMTLHAAKGLEFENVFVIAVEHGILPHIRAMDDPSQLEEERRLLFVGITRAKRWLQLSMAKQRGFSNARVGSASQFAMELPRAELEMIDRTDVDAFNISFMDEIDQRSDEDPWIDEFEPSEKPTKKPSKPMGKKTVLLSRDEWNQEDGGSEFVPDAAPTEEPSPEPSETGNAVLQKLRGKLGLPNLKSGSHFQTITTKEGVEVGLFEQGSIVRHPEYGIGQVASVDGHGARRMARVSFENGELRSFQLNKSPLQLIEA